MTDNELEILRLIKNLSETEENITLVLLEKEASDSTHVAATCTKLAKQQMITANHTIINNELFHSPIGQWRKACGITLLQKGKRAISNVA